MSGAPSVCGSDTTSFSLPGSRPITPGFPQGSATPTACPATPYFNQSANNFNIVQQRINGCHSSRNGSTTTGRQSPAPPGSSAYRSASPAFSASTLPISRRGSVTSLATSGEPPTEV